jgi:hypothetical protein
MRFSNRLSLSMGLVALFLLVATSAQAQQDRRARQGQRQGMMEMEPGALRVGDVAPTFTLKSLDGESETALASFRGEKPVVLLFGSYT